jgi:hypothetical protein
VSTVPAPASTAEALAMIRAGMGYLAAADPAAMAAAAQAECLTALEQLDAVQAAARARILAAFRNAYAPGVTLTGLGQTVGIFALDGFFTADINAYKSAFNLSVPVQVVTLNGYSQTATQSGPNGTPGVNQVETAIDIEMAMAMAPGLQGVVVYEGGTPDSVLAAMASPPAGIPLSQQLSASYTFGITPTSQQIVTQMAAQRHADPCSPWP